MGDVTYYDRTTGEISEVVPTQEELDAGLYVGVGSQSVHSILWHLDKRNPRGTGNSRSDSLFENFEIPVRSYGTANGLINAGGSFDPDSLEGDSEENDTNESEGDQNDPDGLREEPVVDREPAVDFDIISPRANSRVSENDSFTIEIGIQGPDQQVDTVFYYVNNTYLGSGSYRTNTMSFRPSNTRGIERNNTVRVILETVQGRRIEKTASLIIE